LEESGCASAETGWAPQHLSIQIDGKQKGYVPLYIKGHSMGEFIFDHSWAEAAHQSGITYYPKLLVAVPFTPATGQRILFKPDVWKRSGQEIRQIRKAVANFLIQVAESNHLSSVHFNFVTEEEATDLSGSSLALKTEAGDDTKNGKNDKSLQLTTKVQEMLERISPRGTYLRRTSLQYHWTNANPNNHDQPYTNFDEYLACFKSKRRITIRRERQRVLEEQEVRIDAVVGNDIRKYPGLVERMFDIYLSTVDKMIWGRQYLTLEFFQLLVDSTFVDRLCFLCVRPKSSGILLKANDVFAGTFNIVQNGVFYGRYWGCLPGREIKNLHFETCYWSAIDFCIRSGIQRMEPGAGGGGEFLFVPLSLL
jgi:predicted N-acyltransferase